MRTEPPLPVGRVAGAEVSSWERVFESMAVLGCCPNDVIKPLRAALYRCAWVDAACSKDVTDVVGNAWKHADAWQEWGES